MKYNGRHLKMTNPPASLEKKSVQSNKASKPPSSAYVESVRITPERLINAVLKNYQQGGSKGARDE